MIAANQIWLGRGGAKLPYDAEVEYLAVDTIGPYITITGVEWDSFSCSMYVPAQSAQGYRDLIGGNYIYFGCNRICSQNGVYRNGASFMGFTETVNFITDRFVEYHSPSPTNLKWQIDGNEYSVLACRNTGGAFGLFHVPSGVNQVPFKIAWVKTYKSGEVTLDLISVRFTNELGQSEGAMYDRVSGQLFRNQGTGAFLYGRDTNPISARSYVKDGLVAMWDGIENAGWGVHDANGGLVEILSGTATYLRRGSLEVRSDCIRLDTAVLASPSIPAIANLDGSGELTIECCLEWDKDGRAIQWQGGRPFNETMFSNNYTYYMAHTACVDSGLQGSWGSGFHDYREQRALTISSTTVQWWKEGAADTSAARTKNFETTSNVFSLFGWDFDFTFPGSGEFCAFRIYSRALTATEIASNYAVDKARFNLPTAS